MNSAKKAKAQRNASYALRYKQRQCENKQCRHRSCKKGRCVLCGGKMKGRGRKVKVE